MRRGWHQKTKFSWRIVWRIESATSTSFQWSHSRRIAHPLQQSLYSKVIQGKREFISKCQTTILNLKMKYPSPLQTDDGVEKCKLSIRVLQLNPPLTGKCRQASFWPCKTNGKFTLFFIIQNPFVHVRKYTQENSIPILGSRVLGSP